MSQNNHLAGPLPAMQPVHPPKDEAPQVGDTYERASSTKTSPNRPRIRVLLLSGDMVEVVPLNFRNQYGFIGVAPRRMKIRTLFNEWRKLT